MLDKRHWRIFWSAYRRGLLALDRLRRIFTHYAAARLGLPGTLGFLNSNFGDLQILRAITPIVISIYIYFCPTSQHNRHTCDACHGVCFPNDEKVWNPMVEYQYMFGSQLLVAPVYFGHTTKRWVHLPPGLWVDFWDGKQVSGGQEFIINVALEQIAVFARAGSIIPMLDHSPDTLLPSTDPTIEMAGEDLRLQIYPGEDGEFHLYDGSHFIWHEEEQSLTVEGVPTPRWLSLRIMGSQQVFQQAAASNGSINSLQAGAMNGDMHFKRFFAENSQRYRVS